MELALGRLQDAVTLENAADARILPFCFPRFKTDKKMPKDWAQIPTVDFVVSPTISPDSTMGSAIQKDLNISDANFPMFNISELYPSVNPTDYPPLSWSPVAMGVAVETSTPTPSPAPRNSSTPAMPWEQWCHRPGKWRMNIDMPRPGALQRLCLWTAAWHKWMTKEEMFFTSAPQLPALMMIQVKDHDWAVHIVIDHRYKMELKSERIGGTKTVEEAHKLVAALRIMAQWIDTRFRSWAEKKYCRDGRNGLPDRVAELQPGQGAI
ncbi:hypothetical protein VTJ04DRAFT_2259 [Mycothermus thermophilus]|uniref:uncharacterized protein n=1 Tax=Humicola insolens TaxID=85995 RepID=UPI003743CDD1